MKLVVDGIGTYVKLNVDSGTEEAHYITLVDEDSGEEVQLDVDPDSINDLVNFLKTSGRTKKSRNPRRQESEQEPDLGIPRRRRNTQDPEQEESPSGFQDLDVPPIPPRRRRPHTVEEAQRGFSDEE